MAFVGLIGCQNNVVPGQPAPTPHSAFDPATYDPAAKNYPSSSVKTQAHDDNFIYFLPFPNGSRFSVIQGYYGTFSHQNVAALDFGMPEGTEIRAIRDGTVLNAVDGRDWDPSCYRSNVCGLANGNFVVIGHADGSRAYYLHMQKGSVAVSSGQVVRGQRLGLSGSTGNTCGDAACSVPGPHLHLQVYTDTSGTATSKTKFKEVIDAGRTDGYAVQGESYTSQNGASGSVPAPDSEIQFIRYGTGLALNSRPYPTATYSWLYPSNTSDDEQVWQVFKPGMWGGNAGFMFRRRGTNACLNAYQPKNSSDVIAFACDPSDPDQQWDYRYFTNTPFFLLESKGRGFCLNAYQPAANSRVTMYACNDQDGDQQWVPSATPPDTTPPSVSISSPAANSTVTSSALTVSGTAQDNAGGSGIASVQFKLNGGAEQPMPPLSGINFSFNVTLVPGPNTIAVIARDAAGSATTASVSVTYAQGTPVWQAISRGGASPVSRFDFAPGTVGGSGADAFFNVRNGGMAAGSFTLAVTSGPFAVNFAGPQGLGAGQTSLEYTLSAQPCANANAEQGVLRISGNGVAADIPLSRTCSGDPAWQMLVGNLPVSGSIQFATGMVGGSDAAVLFNVKNAGTGPGSFTLAVAPGPFSVNFAGPQNLGAGQTSLEYTVRAQACADANQQQGTLTIAGNGATTTINLVRSCQVAAVPKPGMPTGLNLTMSSNGRLFVSWPEVSSAVVYQFAGTFNGAPLTFSGTVNARSGGTSGAVLVWDANPSDPAKQGKALCVQILARNSGGDSPLSTQVCATYRYYAMTGLSTLSGGDQPTITISQP